ncbi:MAG: protein kinase domain-containing protein [Bryobacteraceae bacterium]
MPLTNAIEAGATLKERYQVVRELGRGGFGVVYLARDLQLREKPVVVKVLTEARRTPGGWAHRKFAQEIEALARIDHPGVVGALDMGELADGTLFLVMQYVDGQTLRQALAKTPMALDRAAGILRQIGSALGAAHEKGIIHRDLKPENILLQTLAGGDEHVKLIDFGIATFLDSGEAATSTLTLIAGSLPYMAPEQLSGAPTLRSDVYALGVVAYEMLTGRRPFVAENAALLYAAQRKGVPEHPRSLRPDLSGTASRLILEALAFSQERRPADARRFVDELARALTPAVRNDDLEIAHVLFMDIVGYSKLPMDQQKEVQSRLQRVVQSSDEYRKGLAGDRLTILPTGDGMALAFFGDPLAPVRGAVEIWKRWHQETSIGLRMGIHSGPVYRVADINLNANVAGGGINVASRVMDCGEGGHILVSETVAAVLRNFTEWAGQIHDLGEVEVKHGAKVRLFNLLADGAGNANVPEKVAASTAARGGPWWVLTNRGDRKGLWAALVLVVVSLLSLATWKILHRPYQPSPESQRWYAQGLGDLREGAYLKASKKFHQATTLDPRNVLAYARLAEAWTELEDPSRARDAMVRSRPPDFDPSRLPARQALEIEAIHHMVTGNHSKSVEGYRELARTAPPSEQAWAQFDLGRAQERNKDVPGAMESYRRALQLDSQNAAVHLRMADLHNKQKRPADARTSLEQAERLYQAASNLEGITEAQYLRAVIANQAGKRPEAAAAIERALTSARLAKSVQQQIRILLQLSRLRIGQSDLKIADQAAKEAVALASENGIENLATRSLIEVGSVALTRGELAEAERYYDQALDAARRNHDPRSEALALINRGSLRVDQGRPDEALADLDEALSYYTRMRHERNSQTARLLIGRARRDRGEYEEAAKVFEDFLARAKVGGDDEQIALAEEGIGSALLVQERFREADSHFETYQRTTESRGDQIRAGFALINRSTVHFEIGDLAEARQLAVRALAVAKSRQSKKLEAAVSRNLAELDLIEGRYPEAERKMNEAVRLAGSADTQLGIESARVQAFRLAHSRNEKAVASCAETVVRARGQPRAWLVLRVELGCAEVALLGKQWEQARSWSREAAARAARGSQRVSEWRALAIGAKADPQDRDAQERVVRAKSALESAMGPRDSVLFFRRPDVKRLF